MSERKPFPIGIDNFEQIIEEGYYYVDKTFLIKELLDLRGKVNLFTRPRRFGKSLNMSMLRSFFEVPADEAAAKKQRDLFNGLAIMGAGEKYTSEMGRYPVIYLTLKSAKQMTWDGAVYELQKEIAREYKRHKTAWRALELEQGEREAAERILNQKAELKEYQTALVPLSQYLEKHYQRKAIILIDEYDVPLENAYFRGFYDKMIGFLRSLLESALKSNDSLAFGVLTGCLRISKESIFTGLNNLEIISIRSTMYAEHFGFSQEEVDELLRTYGCEGSREEVKRWYDGYLFGDVEIYNPWSMMSYVKQKYYGQKPPEAYWSNTSSNDIVRSLIEKADLTVKGELENLIAGGTIEKPIHEDITYEDIDKSQDNLWNFLYFTGYLTKVSERQVGRTSYMVMRIPNEEVASIYENKIQVWFDDTVRGTDLNALYKATLEGDVSTMEQEINRMLIESISYMDSRENFYHGFLAGLYKGMAKCLVESNREEGDGRPDLVLRERSIHGKAIIFELKAPEDPLAMERSCAQALEQIEEQRYRAGLEAQGYRDITVYGIAFYRKDCMVKKM